VSKEL